MIGQQQHFLPRKLLLSLIGVILFLASTVKADPVDDDDIVRIVGGEDAPKGKYPYYGEYSKKNMKK